MQFSDPYHAYVEGSVFGDNPLGLVIALYEATIESIGRAKECLQTGDIPGRTHAINRAMSLLTELLVSLNHEDGGEISANLKRLYSYVQCRILDAHMKQSAAPLVEADKLLSNMLEGWRGAAEKMAAESREIAATLTQYEPSIEENSSWNYDFAPEMSGAGRVSVTL